MKSMATSSCHGPLLADQPLIRTSCRTGWRLGDTCPDGLPFGLLAGIEGREEEILTFGGVTVHPNVFHKVLERLPIAGWQVIDEGDGLRVLLAGAGPGVEPSVVAATVVDALGRLGAAGVRVEVSLVDAIPRTALGKAPLVRRSEPAVAAALRH